MEAQSLQTLSFILPHSSQKSLNLSFAWLPSEPGEIRPKTYVGKRIVSNLPFKKDSKRNTSIQKWSSFELLKLPMTPKFFVRVIVGLLNYF